MSLLKNFVNPWEMDTGVLDTEVLDAGVLDDNILKNLLYTIPQSYYFDKSGNFLGAFKNEIDYIKIVENNRIDFFMIKENFKNKSDKKVFRATLNKYSKNIKDFNLSVRSYSKIFTTILVKNDFDMSKVLNGEISIYNEGKIYNDPHTGVGFADTIHNKVKNNFKISVNILRTRSEFRTVSNVVSALGAHEYIGHGIEKWGSKNGKKTHHKVFELQFAHPSWSKTTIDFKALMLDDYFTYPYSEKGEKYYWKQHALWKKRYGHLKDFDYVWRY